MEDVKQKKVSMDAGFIDKINNEQMHSENLQTDTALQENDFLTLSGIIEDSEQKDEFIAYLLEERKELMYIAASYAMRADLEEIRKIAPSVMSLAELGDEFATLVAAGVSPTTAYKATVLTATEESNPSMGSVGGIYSPEERLYSKREVDFMSKKDIDALSDAQFSKLRKSVTKWR